MAKLIDNGVSVNKPTKERRMRMDGICYQPDQDEYKNRAMLKYDAKGNYLILTKGSIVRLPKDLNMKTGRFSNSGFLRDRIHTMHKEGRVKDIGNGEYIVVGELASRSPSMLAALVKGEPDDGWEFFRGLTEVKQKIID